MGNYFLTEPNVSNALDALEVIFRGIERIGPDVAGQETVDNAIAEINQRLKEHGVGYEYQGELIRIDSELVHAEAVRPALVLLRDAAYSGADQEFRSAFEHYRVGNTKEALNDSLKAIESTLKVIFTKRGWTFNPTDPSKKLLDVAFANGLIPGYWTNHFTSLRSMLESSVPTARNKSSGHGQGVVIQEVPDHLASYVLHMTASTIVFLVKAEQAYPDTRRPLNASAAKSRRSAPHPKVSSLQPTPFQTHAVVWRAPESGHGCACCNSELAVCGTR